MDKSSHKCILWIITVMKSIALQQYRVIGANKTFLKIRHPNLHASICIRISAVEMSLKWFELTPCELLIIICQNIFCLHKDDLHLPTHQSTISKKMLFIYLNLLWPTNKVLLIKRTDWTCMNSKICESFILSSQISKLVIFPSSFR